MEQEGKIPIGTVKEGFPYGGERLPNSFFEANRQKSLGLFKSSAKPKDNTISLFKGIEPTGIYNSDVNYPIHQEGFFYYLFGMEWEENCYAVLDFDSGKPTLFITRLTGRDPIYNFVMTKEEATLKFEMETYYVDELKAWLAQRNPSLIYINKGINSDSFKASLIPEEHYLAGFNTD